MENVAIDLLAGSIGGAVGVFVGHPMDVLKVRMQNDLSYKSVTDCARRTFRGEGLSGFFKGVGPPLASVAVYQAVCFASFNLCLSAVTSDSEDEATLDKLFLAGSLSGIATVPVTTPTDLVKIRLQLQTDSSTKRQYTGMLDCASKIIQREGWYGLSRGFFVTAYRDIMATGFYFLGYHYTKRELAKTRIFGDRTEPIELLAGGVAGVASWGCSCPVDVIKTRIQAETTAVRSSFFALASKIIKEEGFRSLFRGADALLLRAFFVNAVTFYAYEEVIRSIQFLGSYMDKAK